MAPVLEDGRTFTRSYVLTEAGAQFAVEHAILEMGEKRREAARAALDEAIGLYASLSDRHPGIEKLGRLREAMGETR